MNSSSRMTGILAIGGLFIVLTAVAATAAVLSGPIGGETSPLAKRMLQALADSDKYFY